MMMTSPVGTAEPTMHQPSLRGTGILVVNVPGDSSPGYYQSSLTGREICPDITQRQEALDSPVQRLLPLAHFYQKGMLPYLYPDRSYRTCAQVMVVMLLHRC
jgi:hypothetical protein